MAASFPSIIRKRYVVTFGIYLNLVFIKLDNSNSISSNSSSSSSSSNKFENLWQLISRS